MPQWLRSTLAIIAGFLIIAFPHWYTVGLLVLVMPFAWLGGQIRERLLERRGVVAAPVAA